MEDRIGTLQLHYRVSDRASLGPALAPRLDRAVRAGLAEALSERMSAMLGDDASVIVIRELNAPVVLDKTDWSLDGRVVARICRSSADAVAALLSRNAPTESMVRFDDEAAFVGSFIVDLIAGSAWGLWYYGAFRRYRRADTQTTICAVLAESGAEVARVFAWLSRRGRLDAVLSSLGPGGARGLLGCSSETSGRPDGAHGEAVLADAAMRLLSHMGCIAVESLRPAELVSRFLATRPIAPDWTDRRSLSAWALELVRFALARAEQQAAPILQTDRVEAIRSLLSGPLDWLDAPWLTAQLATLMQGPVSEPIRVPAPSRPLLTPRHDRILQRVAERMRSGGIRIAIGDSEDALVVRLIAAASEEAPLDAALHRTLVAAVEQVARAYFAIFGAGNSPRHGVALVGGIDAPTLDRLGASNAVAARHLDELRSAGDSALELLGAVVAARAKPDAAGEVTQAAGVFLLARAVIDLRLLALARRFGIALQPLLGGLAIKWLGVPLPFDHAASLWAGTDRPRLSDLDVAGEHLRGLNGSLLDLLIDRRTLDAATAHEVIAADAALLDRELECSAEANAGLSSTASLLLRAWGSWLPGVGAASPPFLLDNCVCRAGRVQVSPERVAVELDPAPLDVVLQMAGYLAPIERVPWLDERTITFTVRRVANA